MQTDEDAIQATLSALDLGPDLGPNKKVLLLKKG